GAARAAARPRRGAPGALRPGIRGAADLSERDGAARARQGLDRRRRDPGLGRAVVAAGADGPAGAVAVRDRRPDAPAPVAARMNLRPHVVDLYLARTVLLSTLGAAAVILGFDLLNALIGEFEDIGEGGYTLSHAFLYTAYTLPRRLYDAY